jgi:CubicO group peptidase (beta-lactamase class C family)
MPVTRALEEPLASFLSRVSDHYGVPAMAVALFNSDGIVETAGAGTLCVGAMGAAGASAGEVDSDSRFHVGSLAKSMTATVIAMWVEEGVLDWDLTMTDAFPELETTLNPAFASVTLGDVLMHRGGFAPWWSDADEFDVHNVVPGLIGTPREQRDGFATWLLQQPEGGPPGEVQYSNAGYVVASVILERKTGRSWENLMAERLFRPLDMTSAGFGWPKDAYETEPCGHLRDAEQAPNVAPPEYHRLPGIFAPSGDLHMSIRDLAKYGVVHLRGLHGSDGLLRAETVETLHTPVGDYALGWGVGTSPDGERGSSHEGGAGTFFATIGLSHGRDVGCAAMANDGSASAREAAGNACFELLFGGSSYEPPPDAS